MTIGNKHQARNSTQKRAMREKLFKGRDSAKCCFCRRTLTRGTATLEHVIPLANGGDWSEGNLKLSCENCNHERGSQPFDEFRKAKRDKIDRLIAMANERNESQ